MQAQSRSPSIQLIWRLSVFTGLVLVGHLVAMILAIPVAVMTAEDVAGIAVLILAGAAMLLISSFMLQRFDHLGLRAIGIGFDRPWVRQSAVGVGAGAGLIAISWLIFGWCGWLQSELRGDLSTQWVRFTAAAILCIATAVHEELLCRGYAFQLVFRQNRVVAIVVTGLLFVGIHLLNEGGQEPLSLLNLFAAHLLLSVCYLRTRSLWLPIGLHAGWNFTEAFVLGLPLSGSSPKLSVFTAELTQNVWTGHAFGPEGGLIVTLILLAATLWIWRFVKQRTPSADLLAVVAEPATASMTATAPLVPDLAKPTRPAGRILAIDVLRGTAILGILPMNMQIFAGVPPAVIHPYAGDFTDTTNVVTWVLLRLFIGTKDLSTFSMLFGAGMLMQAAAHRDPSESSGAVHYRRMAVLLMLGLIHAYVIWAGDILVTYALVGSLVWLLRRWRPAVLCSLGVMAFAVPMALLLAAQVYVPQLKPELRDGISQALLPDAAAIAEFNRVYASNWISQMQLRFSDALANQTINVAVCMGWVTGGMMLIGMALYKLGLLTAEASKRTYWILVALAALIGYPMLALGFYWNFTREWALPDGFFLGWCLRESAYPIIVLGWIGVVMLVCKSGKLTRLTSPLAAVGRMALTNYLLQSVICHLIFYGSGLGLVGRVNNLWQVFITLAIWIAQLLLSPYWLARYRFGPVEWLWRSLTYGWWQRMRHTPRPETTRA